MVQHIKVSTRREIVAACYSNETHVCTIELQEIQLTSFVAATTNNQTSMILHDFAATYLYHSDKIFTPVWIEKFVAATCQAPRCSDLSPNVCRSLLVDLEKYKIWVTMHKATNYFCTS